MSWGTRAAPPIQHRQPRRNVGRSPFGMKGRGAMRDNTQVARRGRRGERSR